MDQPSAVIILKDLCSAKSVADYYRDELVMRHKTFEMEKKWQYMSAEEALLLEHYQDYM